MYHTRSARRRQEEARPDEHKPTESLEPSTFTPIQSGRSARQGTAAGSRKGKVDAKHMRPSQQAATDVDPTFRSLQAQSRTDTSREQSSDAVETETGTSRASSKGVGDRDTAATRLSGLQRRSTPSAMDALPEQKLTKRRRESDEDDERQTPAKKAHARSTMRLDSLKVDAKDKSDLINALPSLNAALARGGLSFNTETFTVVNHDGSNMKRDDTQWCIGRQCSLFGCGVGPANACQRLIDVLNDDTADTLPTVSHSTREGSTEARMRQGKCVRVRGKADPAEFLQHLANACTERFDKSVRYVDFMDLKQGCFMIGLYRSVSVIFVTGPINIEQLAKTLQQAA